MREAAQAAGLVDVDVVEERVSTGLVDPREIVRYRLSQPQSAEFLSSLKESARRHVVEEGVAAAEETGEAFDPAVVLLAARV